jgi:hypothetical protein
MSASMRPMLSPAARLRRVFLVVDRRDDRQTQHVQH